MMIQILNHKIVMSPGDNPRGRRMNLDADSPTEESSPDIGAYVGITYALVEEVIPERIDVEICEEVLGRRSGYTSGLGRRGPKPPPSRRNFNVDQNDCIKATESELDVTKRKLEAPKSELETTKNSLQVTQNSLEVTHSSLAVTNNKLDIFLLSMGYEILSDK